MDESPSQSSAITVKDSKKEAPINVSSPAAVFKRTQYGQLWKKYSNHDYFHEDSWKPRRELLQRVLARGLVRLLNISIDAGLNFASGMLTFTAVEWWNNRHKRNRGSPEHNISTAVANSIRLLNDPNVHRLIEMPSFGSETNYRSYIIMGLLAYGIYSETENGSNGDAGTNLAIATQLGSAITAIFNDLKELAITLTPTTLNDVEKIYKKILTVNNRKKTIADMPEERKDIVRLLKNEIDKRLRKTEMRDARRHGKEVDVKDIINLVETLDVQIEIYERSIQPIPNIWLYDNNSPQAVKKLKDIKLREKFIYQQISQEEKSQQGMKSFLTRMRLQSSPGYTPPKPGKGVKTYNAIIIWGPGGSGKTYVANLIKALAAEGAIEVMFQVLIDHMKPSQQQCETYQKDCQDPISPHKQYASFTVVMLKSRAALIISNEADFQGRKPGARKDEPDQEWVDRIKNAFDTAADGIIELPAYPPGTTYKIDLRYTSFVFTTNHPPQEEGIPRRFDLIPARGVPLPYRRRAIWMTANNERHELKKHFANLNRDQLRAIDSEVASLMEFLIKESLEDNGPGFGQGIVSDIYLKLGTDYAEGKRKVPENLPDENPMDVADHPEFGPMWEDVPRESIKADLKEIVEFGFTKARGENPVKELLILARKHIEDNNLRGRMLPTVDDYLNQAREKKVKPKETIFFVVDALQEQWADVVEEKPNDIRYSLQACAVEARRKVGYLWSNDDEDTNKHPYQFAELACRMYDEVARMPITLKNLSHAEAGGDMVERQRTMAAIEKIGNRVHGEKGDGDDTPRPIETFWQNYVDSTLPLSGAALEAAREQSPPATTLVLSGPPGGGKKYIASRSVEDLGLRPVVYKLEQFLALFEDKNDERRGGSEIDIGIMGPSNVLGDFDPLTEGDEMDCVILLDIPDYESLPADTKAKLENALRSTGPNPKISFSRIKGFGFELPIRQIPKIVTTRTPVEALGKLGDGPKIAVGKPTPETQRKAAKDAFESAAKTLHAYALPMREKKEICGSAGSMMEYILQAADKQELTPRTIEKATNMLFAHLRKKAFDAMDAKGKQPVVIETESEKSLPLTWEEGSADREKLSGDLVHVVDKAIAEYKNDSGQKSGDSAKEVEKKDEADASGEDTADVVKQLNAIFKKIDPDVLARAVADHLETSSYISSGPENSQVKTLCEAIQKGEEKPIREALMTTDTKLLTRRNTDGDTALHVAVAANKKRAVEILLEASAIFPAASAVDALKRNPLHLAVELGRAEIFELLLNAKKTGGLPMFDVNADDVKKNSVLSLAASSSGDASICNALLDVDGVDVNKQNLDGNSPIHLAIIKSNKVFFEALMEKKGSAIDKTLKNKDGLTASMLAAKLGQKDIAIRLL